MKNKTLAYALFTSIGLALVGGIVDNPDTADLMFSISGIGFMVFGIWSGVRLYKLEDK